MIDIHEDSMYPIIFRKVFCEPWACQLDTYGSIQEQLIHAAEHGITPTSVNQVSFGPSAAGVGLNRPTQPGSRLYTKGAVGVIPIRGVISSHLSSLETMCGGYDIQQLAYDLDAAAEDTNLKRVLIDFHSPGGTITGIPETAKLIKNFPKKTIGFSNGHSASASYWLMSQCSSVLITESASVGSIGVYTAAIDNSKARETRGETVQVFKAGKYKAMGLMGKTLSDDEKALIQESVDKAYAKFTGDVKGARPGIEEATMQGQMFVGKDAVKAKLVDSLVSSLGSVVTMLA